MIDELVFLNDKKIAVTTSLIIAKYFNKRHKNILTIIRELIDTEQELGKLHFRKTFYKDKYNRNTPMYELDRTAVMILCMGFNGKDTLKLKMEYIKKFDALENNIDKLKLMQREDLDLTDEEFIFMAKMTKLLFETVNKKTV